MSRCYYALGPLWAKPWKPWKRGLARDSHSLSMLYGLLTPLVLWELVGKLYRAVPLYDCHLIHGFFSFPHTVIWSVGQEVTCHQGHSVCVLVYMYLHLVVSYLAHHPRSQMHTHTHTHAHHPRSHITHAHTCTHTHTHTHTTHPHTHTVTSLGLPVTTHWCTGFQNKSRSRPR